MLTSSPDLFDENADLIFFHEEKIGSITNNGSDHTAKSVRGQSATFGSYNMACGFLERCYGVVVKKRVEKIVFNQCQLIFQ